ncbi:hypothetical protein FZO89_11270 [Luteimonas viscosa]|uniref:Type II secretion system protein n=1 Tax=Luteimonas viscosa TaxID=1132694 RepID=A0A5D4XS69_9GAMM|nr:hypothetical protein [Luteimonas viscosa]TYT26793.1 hypothetical protein FZO89_11270 [Luteimonas viscosa]
MSGASVGRRLVILAAVVIAATVITAIMVIGSPAAQRASKLDARRVADLRRIEAAIGEHAKLHDALPRDLGALLPGTERGLATVDPDSGASYVFEAIDRRRYRLCADFATDSRIRVRQAEPMYDDAWLHPPGRHCFERRLERDVDARATGPAPRPGPGTE